MDTTAQITWFRQPSETHPGLLNVAYQVTDKPIVDGAADEVVLRHGDGSWTAARLLEDVAWIAGVLRGFGVGPREVVVVDLDGPERLLALLAVARVGAVALDAPADLDDASYADLVRAAAPVLHLTDDHARTHRAVTATGEEPRAVVVRGEGDLVEGRDLSWEFAQRAGRVDPAGCTEIEPHAPVALVWPEVGSGGAVTVRTALTQAERVLALGERPWGLDDLRVALTGA